MKIMIHACPDREWYVNEYLVPSIIEQGIPPDDIQIWMDRNRHGNLRSWVESCESLRGIPGGTWHMQDDVLICHDFAERIRQNDDGIVCGHCHDQYEPHQLYILGKTYPFNMWRSCFQCIRIPNRIAAGFADWFRTAQNRKEFRGLVTENKGDDTMFHNYMLEECGWEPVTNLAPHLVEHVDWLLGGSTINTWRSYIARAAYFYDDDLTDALAEKLAKRRKEIKAG